MFYKAFRYSSARAVVLLVALHGTTALAQERELPRATADLTYTHSNFTSNIPDAKALNLRLTWDIQGGDVLRIELLDEQKFGLHGGIAGVSYTKVLSPDWAVAGTLVFGHDGNIWAKVRADMAVATKWTESRNIVTHVGLYHAIFDGNRSDRGLRLSVAAYLPNAVVLEAGLIGNISDPGAVYSQMPFLSATYGRPGVQYLSLRLSKGTEGYQALGAGQQLVDFHSQSAGLTWRRWMAREWGFSTQAEHYRNPYYQRTTVGGGLFAQW